jgi:hypothetical protein
MVLRHFANTKGPHGLERTQGGCQMVPPLEDVLWIRTTHLNQNKGNGKPDPG